MTPKNRFLKSAGLGWAVCLALVSVSSCIDEMYDLSNGVSMDMELGGDSLAIPIGSTDTIRLADYLDANTISMLKTMEDGGYAISMSDTIEQAIDQIPQDKLKIDDQEKSMSTNIDFGDINLESFKIDGIAIDKDMSLGLGNYSLNGFPIAKMDTTVETSVDISKFELSSLTVPSINAQVGQDNLLAGSPLPNQNDQVPIVVPLNTITIPISSSSAVNSSVPVPGNVSEVSDVMMNSGVFEITISMPGAATALESGTVVPDLTIDPDGLFVFTETPTDRKLHFTEADALTKVNGYTKTKTWHISQLDVSDAQLENTLLKIAKTIASSGSVSLTDASVSTAKVNEVKALDLAITVSINNMTIKSMTFNIPEQQMKIDEASTNLSINNTVPGQIKEINKVILQSGSTISIDLSAVFPPMISDTVMIENLTIGFPSDFVIVPLNMGTHETFVNNKYTLSNYNYTGQKVIQFELQELNLQVAANQDNLIRWSGGISYGGTISFKGRLNSESIKVRNPQMTIRFGSNLAFQSATVTTDDFPIDLPALSVPIDLNTTIAKQVKSLGVIKMKPNTFLKLEITKPSDLPLTFGADNMRIKFPKFFKFAENATFPIDANNNLFLQGTIPDAIVLYLESLEINQELTDGVLKLNDAIEVSGGIQLNSAQVNSSQIEDLSGKTMNVKASSSDIGIASTDIVLNSLAFGDTASIPLQFNINTVPSQVVSLDSVMLKDNAGLQLDVTVTNMPDFGKDLLVDLVVDMPEMFIFEPGTVNTQNQLVIHQGIGKDGKFSKSVGIRGLKFDGKELNGVLSIDQRLKYSANVSIESPTVNSDDLMGKTIGITVNSVVHDIAFKSVYGTLDPGIAPIERSIPLEGLDELKGDDIVLDVSRPVIQLNTVSNLGIPIDVSVKVSPVRGGSADAASTQEFSLKLPKAPTAADLLETQFWIAPDSAGMPTGSNFVQTRLQDVFKRIPDEVSLQAGIATDRSQQHFIDLTATYQFKLKYDVTVPLAFGKDLAIKIEKDIDVNDPKIGEMAKAVGGIELLGSIDNSIPLELELAVIPMDQNGERIAIDTVSQVISAGAHDGSAVKSDLSLKLKDPDGKLKDLRRFHLIFSARSNETVAGTPIKPENFVKADVKVRVDGGISLKDLMEDNE